MKKQNDQPLLNSESENETETNALFTEIRETTQIFGSTATVLDCLDLVMKKQTKWLIGIAIVIAIALAITLPLVLKKDSDDDQPRGNSTRADCLPDFLVFPEGTDYMVAFDNLYFESNLLGKNILKLKKYQRFKNPPCMLQNAKPVVVFTMRKQLTLMMALPVFTLKLGTTFLKNKLMAHGC